MDNLTPEQIIRERVDYYSSLVALIEEEIMAINGLVVFYETEVMEHEEIRLLHKREVSKLKREELSLRNEITAKTTLINEYLSRQEKSKDYINFIKSIWDNKEGLIVDAVVLSENHPNQYIRDRIKALLKQIESKDFDAEDNEIKDKVMLMLFTIVDEAQRLSQKKPESKLIKLVN